jgi:hypothetical protein
MSLAAFTGQESDEGRVRVYEWTESQRMQLGSNLDEVVGEESYYYNVAISSNGNRVVVVGTHSSEAAAGRVQQLYDCWTGSQWMQVGSDMNGNSAGDLFGWRVAISSDGNRVAIAARGHDGSSSGIKIVMNGSDQLVRIQRCLLQGCAVLQLGNGLVGFHCVKFPR